MNIIVVGAGIAGLSTAWALAKAGHSVSILEQGPIPNPLAASGDHHRIIRRAYGYAPGYGRLITEAYDAWDELWADLGQSHSIRAASSAFRASRATRPKQYRDGMVDGGWPIEVLEPRGGRRALAVPGARHVSLCLLFAGRRRAALPKDRVRAGGMAARHRRQCVTKTAR